MMGILETSPILKIWEDLAIWVALVTWEEVRPLSSHLMARTWEVKKGWEEWEELIPIKFSQCLWEEAKEVLEVLETSDKGEDLQTILQKRKEVEKCRKILEDLLLMTSTFKTSAGEDSAPLVEILNKRRKTQDDLVIIFNDILNCLILITIFVKVLIFIKPNYKVKIVN